MHRLPPEHQRHLDELPRYYWWHRHRIGMALGQAKRFLKPGGSDVLNYIDLGAGTGATTLEVARGLARSHGLLVNPDHVTGVEADTSLDTYQSVKPIRFLRFDMEGDWAADNRRHDFFTALDVIEHLANPVRFLQTLRGFLTPGAVGVLNVPAYDFLFSDWDRQLGHQRRYTRGLLLKQCEEAGYRVLFSTYLFSFLLPPAYLLRKMRASPEAAATEFPAVPSWMNHILCGVCAAERAWTHGGAIPFGTSVFCTVQAL